MSQPAIFVASAAAVEKLRATKGDDAANSATVRTMLPAPTPPHNVQIFYPIYVFLITFYKCIVEDFKKVMLKVHPPNFLYVLPDKCVLIAC